MTASAVCGACNADVGFDATSCHACGRVFPTALPTPARSRRRDDGDGAAHFGVMFAVSFVVTGIVYVASSSPPDGREGVGYLVGQIFGAAIAPVALAGLARLASRKAAWIVFALVLVLANGRQIANAPAAAEARRAEKASMRALADTQRALIDRQRTYIETGHFDGPVGTGAPPAIHASRSKAELMTQFAAVLRAASDDNFRLQMEHQAEVERLGAVLGPEHFVDRKGLAECRAAIAAYRKAYDRLDTGQAAVRARALEDLETIARGRPEHDALMASVREGLQSATDLLRRLRANQRSQADGIEQLLDFMGARLGHVTLGHGRLVFEREDDLVAFNEIAESLASLTNEERRLLGELVALQQASLRRSSSQ